ncbi:MAG: hypothetical protein U9Q35_02085 [Pseudomonadota bacterium]|jgi:hypothetical protein|nr:hypothetical protein [Pseudomonadota bacterium]
MNLLDKALAHEKTLIPIRVLLAIGAWMTVFPIAQAGDGSLIGPQPYNFPARSAQAAAILYESKQNASSSGSSGSATIYSNTTISATNWQQIEMTLGDNAQGSLSTDSSQTSNGGTATSQSDFLSSQEEELAQ